MPPKRIRFNCSYSIKLKPKLIIFIVSNNFITYSHRKARKIDSRFDTGGL